MSQQGARPARQEDDWWGELYDGTTQDTGPAQAPDSLDDRFASARNAVTERPRPPEPSPSREPSPPPDPSTSPEPERTGPPLPDHLVAPASLPDYVGSGPPTYEPEPTALPPADPDALDGLAPDTVLDGARYGACTLRAVSQRGDSARYRGEPRRDALLTARFGAGDQALVLVAMATGARAVPGAHLAAAEACRGIARAVGRSHQRLAQDIRATRRGDLRSGLHRLTDRALGGLRASAATDAPVAVLRCLLLPADPDCRIRVFFGVGDGGLFRLRDGAWQDIEPRLTADDTAPDAPPGDGRASLGPGAVPGDGRASLDPGAVPGDGWTSVPGDGRASLDLGALPGDGRTAPNPGTLPRDGRTANPGTLPGDGRTAPRPGAPRPGSPDPRPPREPFLFRASVARPGDVLVLCTAGLADPLREAEALRARLARRWSGGTPPGLAAFLADARVRVKGYADDRTAAAVWEA
ncbi:protein phosphatase 2C domain-containing protein [Streptomyces lavenduligriseus]|uniref:protein phosphatase 2C domain-containing protein n=1 Tax=Streptomyces lavenduligriseus TaxID=67315 RepID=UPI0004C4C2FA|nr:protein phosphatase 2C domain-containing protein [Streptomyces lavenduligriseus]